MLAPREYQLRAIDACRAQYRGGRRAVVLVLPTGAGKTVVASVVVRAHIDARPTNRVLFVVHRNELEEQAEEKFRQVGIAVGPMFRVEIRSIQSLIRGDRPLPEATLWVFDECHHLSDSNQWGELPKRALASGALVLGLTATPSRGDGRALAGFDALVVGVTPKYLTEHGYLVPCDIIAPGRDSEMGDPVEAMIEHAPGRPSIVFASTVAQAENYAQRLRSLGVRAASVDGTMRGGTNELAKRLREFKRGELDALTSVHVLTEGFDATRAEVCVIGRGCAATITWLQMIGRVLRPHPGKTSALVIDCKGSVYDFGFPTDDRKWSLEGKQGKALEKLEAIKQCPQCGAVFRPAPVCPRCQFTFPKRELTPAKRVEMKQVTAVDRFGPRAEQAFRAFQAIAKHKGYKPGWASVMFKNKFGAYPPKHWGGSEAHETV